MRSRASCTCGPGDVTLRGLRSVFNLGQQFGLDPNPCADPPGVGLPLRIGGLGRACKYFRLFVSDLVRDVGSNAATCS
jgi:hypothetical protein